MEKLQVVDKRYAENLELAKQLCYDSDKRVAFLRAGLIGTLLDPRVRKEFDAHKHLTSAILEQLSREEDWAMHVAVEREVLSLALGVVFRYVRPMVSGTNLYTEMTHPDSQFFAHTQESFVYLRNNLSILVNLAVADESILREIAKFNIVPKLLYVIDKVHTSTEPGDQASIAVPCKSLALTLLNLCLRLREVADRTCKDVDTLLWYFRVLEQSIVSVHNPGLVQSLAYLSRSTYFTPTLQGKHIIRDWTYGTLCSILMPERRDHRWYEVNPEVLDEERQVETMDHFLQTLVNTSNTNGGVQEIMYSIFHHNSDILWRSFAAILHFKPLPTHLMMVCLNLANNMLRYPGYKPPKHSST